MRRGERKKKRKEEKRAEKRAKKKKRREQEENKLQWPTWITWCTLSLFRLPLSLSLSLFYSTRPSILFYNLLYSSLFYFIFKLLSTLLSTQLSSVTLLISTIRIAWKRFPSPHFFRPNALADHEFQFVSPQLSQLLSRHVTRNATHRFQDQNSPSAIVCTMSRTKSQGMFTTFPKYSTHSIGIIAILFACFVALLSSALLRAALHRQPQIAR